MLQGRPLDTLERTAFLESELVRGASQHRQDRDGHLHWQCRIKVGGGHVWSSTRRIPESGAVASTRLHGIAGEECKIVGGDADQGFQPFQVAVGLWGVVALSTGAWISQGCPRF